MRTEKEVKDETKWARYERFKKEPVYNESYVAGYYHALRWVLGKEKPLTRGKKKETQKDIDKLVDSARAHVLSVRFR